MLEGTLTLHAYCGMSQPIIRRDNSEPLADCRSRAARIIRRARINGQPVCTLDKGASWELGEPEGCSMIPDNAGTLSLDPVYRCDYCGRECEPGAECCEACDTDRMDWEPESYA